MDFFKLKNSDQIYFYLDSWCSAGGNLEPGTVFFINSVVIIFFFLTFLPLDPDPDPDSGSGSKDLIESGSNPDPDPKHCLGKHFVLTQSSVSDPYILHTEPDLDPVL